MPRNAASGVESVRPDGSVILCTGFSEKINGDKREQTIMSMMKNVPNHKKLEKALRDSEEKYRVLFISLP